ncbi:MAG TPA: hypothetical protein VL359_03510, partial [bacterium]|nr:hypothetical protein [bacterium]
MQRNRMTTVAALVFISLTSGVGGLAPALGASYYWDGEAGAAWNTSSPNKPGSNWSLSPDFVQNSFLGLPGSADDVYFYFGANHLTDNVLGQGFSVRSLNFLGSDNAPVTIDGGSAVGANTLTLGAGGITVSSASGAVGAFTVTN